MSRRATKNPGVADALAWQRVIDARAGFGERVARGDEDGAVEAYVTFGRMLSAYADVHVDALAYLVTINGLDD